MSQGLDTIEFDWPNRSRCWNI